VVQVFGRQRATGQQRDAEEHDEGEASRPHAAIVPDRPSRGSSAREWLGRRPLWLGD
jgi:hypothetical protein